MTHLSFWIAGIVVPLVIVAVNCVFRVLLGKPQSAAADIILTLMVFDAVVIIQADDFKKFIPKEFQIHLVSIYFVIFLVNLIFWFISVLKIEDSLDSFFDRNTRRYQSGVWAPISGAVVISVIVIGLNVLPFAYEA